MKIDRSKLSKEEVEYLDQIEAQIAKASEPVPAPVEIPEAVQKMLDAQATEIAKANTRAENAEKAAAVEKEARERADFAKTAETDIPHLPGTSVEKGNTLYAVAKAVDAKVFEALMTLLKAGSVAVDANVLIEDGDSNASGTAGTAFDQLAKIAKDAVVSGVHKTFEQAFDAACTGHPALWKEYRTENRRSVVA